MGRVSFCYFAILIPFICTFITLRFTLGTSFSNNGRSYGPTDTKLIPFSKTFCQSLSLQTNFNGSNEYNISFFMLSHQPQLFGQRSFSILERIFAEVEQHYLVFMLSGSNVTASACFLDGAPIVPSTYIYIVKGTHGYSGGYLDSKSKSIVADSYISYDCHINRKPLSYSVDDDNFYYLIFQTNEIGDKPLLHLEVSMSFYQTHYAVYDDPIISSCTLLSSNLGSKCSLPVPLAPESYVLLSIDPVSSDVEKLDEIPLETYCEPRLWVYILPSVLFTCVFFITVSYCCGIKRSNTFKSLMCCYWVRKKIAGKVLFCFLFISVLIIINIFLHYTKGVSFTNSGQSYSPIDSRLIPFSNIFCQSLSLQINYNGSNDYSISFLMLPSHPQLSENERFFISEEVLAEVEQHYLLYLHSGSEVTASACFINSFSIVPFTSLYIIQGVDGYNGGYRKEDIKNVVAQSDIFRDCSQGNASSVHYSVKEDDFYYVILHSSKHGTVPVLHVKLEMSLDLTHYGLNYYDDTIIESCSLSTLGKKSKCSLHVPLRTSTYALLTIHPASSDLNMLDKISLKTSCEQRYWVYIVPSILLTLALALISGLIFAYDRTDTAKLKEATAQEFAEIKDKFEKDWAKGSPQEAKAVFVIKNKLIKQWRFQIYRLSLCQYKEIESYYHGTKITCDIITNKQLCKDVECGACRISEFGFMPIRIGSNLRWRRFGKGFYLAPNSSKSNDYSGRLGAYGCNAILLCDVCPGKKYKLKKSNDTLNGPPEGFHSIYGEAGEDLNYDEIVLSKSAAILPRYIILY